jgi:hypothetical protein
MQGDDDVFIACDELLVTAVANGLLWGTVTVGEAVHV